MSVESIVKHRLPDGTWLSLWAVSDLSASRWSFLWVEVESERLPEGWYRVHPARKSPGEWLRLMPGDEVLRRSGFADHPDILSDTDPPGAQLGAAEMLQRGQYLWEAKFHSQGRDIQVSGPSLTVK